MAGEEEEGTARVKEKRGYLNGNRGHESGL